MSLIQIDLTAVFVILCIGVCLVIALRLTEEYADRHILKRTKEILDQRNKQGSTEP